jgi:hypothetical protein
VPGDVLTEILKLKPEELDRRWREIDAVLMPLPISQQISAWNRILEHIGSTPIPRGHPYFRLGVLHLLSDLDEAQGLSYLDKAFREDCVHAPPEGKLPHRMGAYRLLALCKGFFEYLRGLGGENWQAQQLKEPHREILIRTLLTLYDQSLLHPIEMQRYTYQEFFALIRDRRLCAFAIENYFCVEALIEMATLKSGQAFLHQHEYPLARAAVGLVGGVLEAILADRLDGARGRTLGGLIKEGHERGIVLPGTPIAALSSLMLYLRNHVHADRALNIAEYYIDINVANGCKVALDWVISELLNREQSTSTNL